MSTKTFCGENLFHQFQVLREFFLNSSMKQELLSVPSKTALSVWRKLLTKFLSECFFSVSQQGFQTIFQLSRGNFWGKKHLMRKIISFFLLSVSRSAFYWKSFIVFRNCKFFQYFRFLSKTCSVLCPKRRQFCQNCIYLSTGKFYGFWVIFLNFLSKIFP